MRASWGGTRSIPLGATTDLAAAGRWCGRLGAFARRLHHRPKSRRAGRWWHPRIASRQPDARTRFTGDPHQWEPFVRYAGLLTDDDRTAEGENTFGSLTVGVNYSLYGHASKFTADVVWYLDEIDPLVTSRSGRG